MHMYIIRDGHFLVAEQKFSPNAMQVATNIFVWEIIRKSSRMFHWNGNFLLNQKNGKIVKQKIYQHRSYMPK